MVEECGSCDADDELLFTCSYCDERFCASHQFPHHACEGFGRAAEAGGRSAAAEPRPVPEGGSTVDADEPAAGAVDGRGTVTLPAPETDPLPRTVTPPKPSQRAESLATGTWSGSGSPPAGTGDGVVNVRAMDSRRVVGGTEASAAPRTVGDWISRQTYLTLLVKVGVIALLVNTAFYGGMAVTLYGLLPFAL